MSIHLQLMSLVDVSLVALQLTTPLPSVAQSFRRDQTNNTSQINTIYDRITDSTRVSVLILSRSRRFGLGSWVSLDASAAYAGRRPTRWPADVVLAFEAFTPSRGGWAFARRRELHIRSGDVTKLEVAPAEYVKHPVHFFDSGRRDALYFRIPTAQIATLASEAELTLKVGNANVRLDERRMAVLRKFVESVSPPPGK
jgi:hypothetical protein